MRFVFDTSVLIDYLRDPNDIAADALFVASDRGQVFVSLVSLMELYLPRNKSNKEIAEEVTRIRELCTRLGIRIIPSSQRSQEVALDILRETCSILGRNALPDSLILGIGITRRAYLVTRDQNWFRIDRRGLEVISPKRLVERFG